MTQKVKKFTLTAEELEDIAPTLSAAPHHPRGGIDMTDYAIPVSSWDEGWRLRKLARVLTLDPIGHLKYVLEQLSANPGIFGGYDCGQALATFKEATQEAVKNLALAEIDHKIHNAEAGISVLKKNRARLEKEGEDVYKIFTRPL